MEAMQSSHSFWASLKIGLAALSIAIFITLSVYRIGQIYKYAMTRNKIEHMMRDAVAFYAVHGRFPSENQLSHLRNAPTSPEVDQWQHPIVIHIGVRSIWAISYGRDGEIGGDGFCQDIIVSWHVGAANIVTDAGNYRP